MDYQSARLPINLGEMMKKKIKPTKETTSNDIDILTLENRVKFLIESCPTKDSVLKTRYKIEINAIKAGIRALKAENKRSNQLTSNKTV
jgi:hypothetical protein